VSEGRGSKAKGLLWVVLALLGGAAVAGGFSWLARGVPGLVECTGARGQAALSTVVRRLYPTHPEDFAFAVNICVVRGATVNAFAGLGGRIFVYEGLLREARSAEELAGVLAHEIEHVRGRHILEGLLVKLMSSEVVSLVSSGSSEASSAQVAGLLLGLRFGREQERAADEGGLRRLRDAQVDVSGFKRFFERMAGESVMPTLLSDHPASEDRATMVERFRGGKVRAILSAEEWKGLREICR
jgi:beta-barrel assembly-enhancing protease